ncbi:PPK2 family polyphosphate kinase [Geofilum rubicundum]|uniref:Bll6474 protein n=1 Tax=Geofilum rubicundum JCM 15548 TaxID=1236989 RepID=A0A0E9LUV1_9BACT|nr:PPK2 family polyphosphate kinase [Geofilum rubicundum]GAO28886.1 Bll6474 protein [Geofilum rubicundum JCM 15548]
MQEINSQSFLVTDPVQLDKTPTVLETDATKKEKKKALKEVGKKLSKMQDTMYAHNRHGVLVCLQGMDTSGKDSLIREVFSKFNPRGVVVHSFKSPSKVELQYDYLWRHYLTLPQKGKYAIFNRSHYENVLVTRVNPGFLLKENIPGLERVEDIPLDFWEKRFEQIRNFEKHITQNGTIVFKFFLHLSKDEQRQRLLRRLEKKEKIWKFTPSDISERELWDDYQKNYEEAINNTSTPHAPWHIIPADDKKMARYLVAGSFTKKCRNSPIYKNLLLIRWLKITWRFIKTF